jgi:hypothetical protein
MSTKQKKNINKFLNKVLGILAIPNFFIVLFTMRHIFGTATEGPALKSVGMILLFIVGFISIQLACRCLLYIIIKCFTIFCKSQALKKQEAR